MTETIVVGVDGSDASKAALGWAASLAELTGATIVAVHSWGPIYPVGVDPEQGARTHITRVLEEVLGADRAEATRLVVSPDAPGHLLVHEAADADLLVVGSHGRGHGA